MREMKVSELELMLRDYRLTTAEILYHLPDHPALLQTYIWQELDKAPRYPELKNFLDFWERELEGRLHSVTLANTQLISAAEFKQYNLELRVH